MSGARNAIDALSQAVESLTWPVWCDSYIARPTWKETALRRSAVTTLDYLPKPVILHFQRGGALVTFARGTHRLGLPVWSCFRETSL